MKLRKTLLFMIVAIYSLSFSVAKGAANTPTDDVKYTIDSVLKVLKDEKLSAPGKEEERRARISFLLRERFDFREMARRSLAKHWKKRTPEEEKEFTAIFSDLLEASYISKIEAYSDERVTFDKEVIKGKGKYGVVSTTIATKNVDIPIDYKVKLKNGNWWVYDVVVEGVSFISTYRSQYNKVIIKESFAKLIQRMKNKLNEVNAI